MKSYIIICFLTAILLFSCNNNEHKEDKSIQVESFPELHQIIDSIIRLNQSDNKIYKLFVDKTVEYRCDMILHIGTKPFYEDNKMSLCYMISNNKKVSIYSGVESYFNLPGKDVNYGRTDGITENENNLLWIIHLYKDSIIYVYSVGSVNPFLLIPASPKYFQEIEKTE